MGTRAHRLALAAAAALLAGGPASAQLAWEAQPRISVGGVFEDNPRLRASGAADNNQVAGGLLDAEMRLSARTQRTELQFRPRIRSSRYLKDNPELEDDDIFLRLNLSHLLERMSFGLGANYEVVGTRSSEFISAIPDDPDDPPPVGDTGELVRVDDERTLWSVNPSFSWALTERNRLDLFAGYTNVSFERSGLGSRGDYDYISSGATFSHAFDARNRVFTTATYNRFESDRAGFIVSTTSNDYGLSVGYERALSETWTATVSLGANRNESRTVIDPPQPVCDIVFDPEFGFIIVPCPDTFRATASNFIGSGELRRRGELMTVTAALSRAITPSASGTEVVRDTARLFFDRDFTPLLSGTLGIVVFSEESVGEFATRDRTYLRIDTVGRWRLAREWFARVSYAYTRDQDDLRVGGDARERHRVFVGLEYQGLGWRSF